MGYLSVGEFLDKADAPQSAAIDVRAIPDKPDDVQPADDPPQLVPRDEADEPGREGLAVDPAEVDEVVNGAESTRKRIRSANPAFEAQRERVRRELVKLFKSEDWIEVAWTQSTVYDEALRSSQGFMAQARAKAAFGSKHKRYPTQQELDDLLKTDLPPDDGTPLELVYVLITRFSYSHEDRMSITCRDTQDGTFIEHVTR